MAVVLEFPPRRRRRAAAKQNSAKLKLFPLDRDARIVRSIAQEMRAAPSDDQAEAILIGHIEVEISRLTPLGFSDDEIEHVCQAFAVAAWSAAVRGDEAEGAA